MKRNESTVITKHPPQNKVTPMSLLSYDPSLWNKSKTESEPSLPKVIPLGKIENAICQLLSTDQGIRDLFSSQDEAFRHSTQIAKINGIASSLPIQTLGQHPQPPLKGGHGSQMCIKSGYRKGGDTMVTKIAAGGTDNCGNTGSVLVFDQTTLRLMSILCDEGLLTEVRTAAACAYASKCILGSNMQQVTKLGIVGGGVQAVWQLRLLHLGGLPKECRTVVVKTRSKESAEAFFQRMKSSSYLPDRNWIFEHYQSTVEGGKGFKDCTLIHTMTPAREPVLRLQDVNIENPFLHITCVGADSPGKRELSDDLIAAANHLFCDSIDQTKERGEFQSLKSSKDIVELGTFLEEQKMHHIAGLSIFDSSGLPLQDVEMAQLISSYIS